MIVVEGPDGSGKTTLCNEICANFGLRVGRRATTNRDEVYKTTRHDTWWAMYDELKCDRNKPWVWDRLGPVSDPIYSSFGIPHERECAFTRSEIETFYHFTNHLGLLILCLPSLEVVQANVSKEHQLENVVERTRGIYARYKALSYSRPFFVYNYERPGALGSMATLVGRYLLARKEREQFSLFSTPAT